MSFQDLSEDGTKYPHLLTAKRQEKPTVQACNAILSNLTGFSHRASVAWNSFMATATSALPFPLIVHSNYNLQKPFLPQEPPLGLGNFSHLGANRWQTTMLASPNNQGL